MALPSEQPLPFRVMSHKRHIPTPAGFLTEPKHLLTNVPTPVSVCIAVLYAAIPWAILALRSPRLSSVLTVDLIERFGVILFAALLIGMFLAAQHHHNEPWVIFTHVVAGAVFIEGQFACHYYVICRIWPESFAPRTLSRVDAAFFTISTATTTGIGDIYPASSYARLIVSAQMVFSFVLLVVAIGTALHWELAHATADHLERDGKTLRAGTPPSPSGGTGRRA